jgi:hypothetical protein
VAFNTITGSRLRSLYGVSNVLDGLPKALLRLSEEFYAISGRYPILSIYEEDEASWLGAPVGTLILFTFRGSSAF